MLRKIDKAICRIQEVFLATNVILMATILIGNFVARKVFNNSWSFSEEIGKFVIIFVTFVGTTLAARHGDHIVMTVFVDMLKPKAKLMVVAVTNLLTAVMFGLFFYYSVNYVSYTHQLGFTSSALRVPMYIIYISLPVSFFLSMVEYFKLSYANLKGKYLFEDLYHEDKEGELC